MDLTIIQIALRLLLTLVAVSHIVEGAVRPRGIAWRLPMGRHLPGVAASIVAFGAAIAMLMIFDARVGPGALAMDLALLALVEAAILLPPWNAVSTRGITVAGRRHGWGNYLGHTAEEPEGGYQLVRLEYRVWKFVFTRRFHAPPAAVRAMDGRGRVGRGSRGGTARAFTRSPPDLSNYRRPGVRSARRGAVPRLAAASGCPFPPCPGCKRLTGTGEDLIEGMDGRLWHRECLRASGREPRHGWGGEQ